MNYSVRFIIKGSIFLFLMLSLSMQAHAQRKIRALEESLEIATGVEKIKLYNEVIEYHLYARNIKKADLFASEAENYMGFFYSEDDQDLEVADLQMKAETLFKIGEAYKERNKFLESKEVLNKVIVISKDIDLKDLFEDANSQIGEIEIIIDSGDNGKNIFQNTFKEIGSLINKTSSDIEVSAALKMADIYVNSEDFEEAMKQLTIALKVLEENGNDEKAEEVELRIEDVIKTLVQNSSKDAEGNQPNVNVPAQVSTKKIETLDQKEIARSKPTLKIQTPTPDVNISNPPSPKQPPATVRTNNARSIIAAAKKAESNSDFQRSLDYYKQYIELEQSVQEERSQQQLVLLEQANELENRDKAIRLYKQNKKISELELEQKEIDLQKQKNAKRSFGIGLGLLGAVLLSLYWLFVNKKKAHSKLGLAYDELNTTQINLETAQLKIKNLLQQQVSGAVADELLASTGDQKIERRFVCIMFLDIRDFTVFAENKNPEEIIDYQNEVFGFMIETITKNNGIVNQILGDGFMATFGAPHTSGQDCHDAYKAAQEIIAISKSKTASGEIPPTKVGIGLHAGYVVTGNVGTQNRKQYSITGNPVIIASRLEQLNKTYGSSIVISKNVYELLPKEDQTPMEFNSVTVKGRNEPVEVAAI